MTFFSRATLLCIVVFMASACVNHLERRVARGDEAIILWTDQRSGATATPVELGELYQHPIFEPGAFRQFFQWTFLNGETATPFRYGDAQAFRFYCGKGKDDPTSAIAMVAMYVEPGTYALIKATQGAAIQTELSGEPTRETYFLSRENIPEGRFDDVRIDPMTPRIEAVQGKIVYVGSFKNVIKIERVPALIFGTNPYAKSVVSSIEFDPELVRECVSASDLMNLPIENVNIFEGREAAAQLFSGDWSSKPEAVHSLP